MNKDELLQALRKERIRDDAFDLGGGHRDETYTLAESYGRWFVYYSEKGLVLSIIRKRRFLNSAGTLVDTSEAFAAAE